MADLDIGGILSSLSKDDIENLKNVASSFFGGAGGEKKVEESFEKEKKSNTTADFSSLGLPDMSQLQGLLPLLSALNSHDDREDFIYALKPLLSNERQKKADEALKLIKLLSIIPLLREKGIM